MLELSFVNFRKGSYIFVEGKTDSNRFFILQRGSVRCFKQMDVTDGINRLGPGDFVGVIPCMAGRSQIETVVAETDAVAISVRKDQYPDLIKKNPPVALKIIKTFATRLRFLNETLTQMTLNTMSDSSAEQLYTTAAYYEKSGQRDLATFGYYQYLKECPKGEHANKAKQRFATLKPSSRAVYFEQTAEPIRAYPKNTMIFSECQGGQEMYIIQEGQVKITKVVDDNEVILAVLKKGDFFGEMALLENKPRSASAIAYENCNLMVINSKNFDQMVTTQPQLIATLTTTLAERLWTMSRQLANAKLETPHHKLIDMLALQIEKLRLIAHKEKGHQFDLTMYDLANMCGMPKEQQALALTPFMQDQLIRMVGNKIYVTDCEELVKTAAFYRKQQQQKKTVNRGF